MTPVQQLDISFRNDFDMRLDSIDRRTVLLVRGEFCPEHRPRVLPFRFAAYEAVWVDPGVWDCGPKRSGSNGLQYLRDPLMFFIRFICNCSPGVCISLKNP